MIRKFKNNKSIPRVDSPILIDTMKINSKTVKSKNIIASIIIPTVHPSAKLSKCISCLENQSEQNFELIIIDNGSDYDYSNLKCSLEYVSIIKNNMNLGFSRAVNQGINISNCKYLVILNDDAYPMVNWLKSLIEVAEYDDKNGLVTSKLYFNTPPYLIQNTGMVNSKRFGVGISRDIGRCEPLAKNGSEVLAPCGAALLIKKEFIDDVGLFDENYFAYSEDKDLGLRGWIKGWKCVYADADVFHDHSSTGKQFSEFKTYYVVRNEILLAFKLYPVNKLISYILFKNITYLIYLKYFMTSTNNNSDNDNTSGEKLDALKLASIVFRAHFDAIKMGAKMLQKRRAIWKDARITKKEFAHILEIFGLPDEYLRNEIEILNRYG